MFLGKLVSEINYILCTIFYLYIIVFTLAVGNFERVIHALNYED